MSWLWDFLFGDKTRANLAAADVAIEPPNAPSAPPAPRTPLEVEKGTEKEKAPPAEAVVGVSDYGVDQAIELMRTLPFDEDPELVLRVVRKTLQSIGISVPDIIKAATFREDTICATLESDRASISDLEHEIANLQANINRLLGELREARDVRERLEEALAGQTKVGLQFISDPNIRVPGVHIGGDAADAPKPFGARPPPPAGLKPPGPGLPKINASPALKPPIFSRKVEAPAAPRIGSPPATKLDAHPTPKPATTSEGHGALPDLTSKLNEDDEPTSPGLDTKVDKTP